MLRRFSLAVALRFLSESASLAKPSVGFQSPTSTTLSCSLHVKGDVP